MKIIPIILCGGKGSRLWPLSRKSFPKQFLAISSNSELSLLQQTYKRLDDIDNLDNPILICNEEHRFIVAEQMREVDVNPKAIILEPSGRNTAPAIALGAIKASMIEEESILLILSADHKIEDKKNFINVIKAGYQYALNNRLVTFGVIPTYPETGYGYIESEKSFKKGSLGGLNITKFIEKPSIKKAEMLFQDKKYTWNSGIFMFKTSSILKELNKYQPSIVEFCTKALKKSSRDLDFTRVDNEAFEKSPNISIDVAVMERTNIGTVLPLDAKWSDVGSWKSLWNSEQKDAFGNVIQGKVIDIDSYSCYLNADSRLLVTMGLKNIVVVETSDAIFVANKDKAVNVKSIVNKLEEKGYSQGTQHRKIFRPWGNYTSLIEDKSWQVKKIEVKPHESLSLQMHHHRAEHWIIVKGIANVQIDEETFILNENQSTFIPLGSKHRLSNPGDNRLVLIEVQSGNYLGEDDIVRFEDNYGRNKF